MARQAIIGVILAALSLFGTPGMAQDADPARVARLAEALHLRAMVDILREEGIADAPEIAGNMFPGRGGPGWRAEVAEIYDTNLIWAEVEAVLLRELSAESVEVNLAFFSGGLGQRFADAEYEGRKALLDPEIDAAAREVARELQATGDPRLEAIAPLIAAYNLIEANVVGGLNSSMAFYLGLQAGGALNAELSEGQILAEVWGQEPDIRADTQEWLFAYLLLAYSGFDDGELERYSAFARTDAAQEMNRVIFAAFDVVFERISRDLGRAVAGRLQAEDI